MTYHYHRLQVHIKRESLSSRFMIPLDSLRNTSPVAKVMAGFEWLRAYDEHETFHEEPSRKSYRGASNLFQAGDGGTGWTSHEASHLGSTAYGLAQVNVRLFNSILAQQNQGRRPKTNNTSQYHGNVNLLLPGLRSIRWKHLLGGVSFQHTCSPTTILHK